jgi:hypothetical protein
VARRFAKNVIDVVVKIEKPCCGGGVAGPGELVTLQASGFDSAGFNPVHSSA